MKNRIIAIDFDGTVVTHEYPDIGIEIPHCLKVLKRLIENETKIILWTMRHGVGLEQAIEWFKEKNIPLWAINENPEQISWTDSRKCYAQAYIDDAAIGCPTIIPSNGRRRYVDWERVELLLIKDGFLDEISNSN